MTVCLNEKLFSVNTNGLLTAHLSMSTPAPIVLEYRKSSKLPPCRLKKTPPILRFRVIVPGGGIGSGSGKDSGHRLATRTCRQNIRHRWFPGCWPREDRAGQCPRSNAIRGLM